MTDDVLAVKYSPDHKLLAVSLLDSTVKVFFQDSLKFFLSLYGHKVCRICKETHTSGNAKADRNTSPRL
jgi:U3 small nucleolar RNA-associated protein 12